MTHHENAHDHLEAAKDEVKSAAETLVGEAKEKMHDAVEAVSEKLHDAVEKVPADAPVAPAN
jgi:uncharacterized protein YjbJ (UPF0337 family)